MDAVSNWAVIVFGGRVGSGRGGVSNRTQHEGLQPRHKYLITRVETALTKINLECKRTKTHLTIGRSFLCIYTDIVAFIETD
jgi:hypothetical protein